MLLSYQYRIYPLPDQLRLLAHHRREVTFLWNYALGQRQDAGRIEIGSPAGSEGTEGSVEPAYGFRTTLMIPPRRLSNCS
jgi:helix-turn-helix protein